MVHLVSVYSRNNFKNSHLIELFWDCSIDYTCNYSQLFCTLVKSKHSNTITFLGKNFAVFNVAMIAFFRCIIICTDINSQYYFVH